MHPSAKIPGVAPAPSLRGRERPAVPSRLGRLGFKRPESVLVLVYTEGREVLLVQRARPLDFWQSVTGSLKWDECPALAARRELYEETGLKAGQGLLDCQMRYRFRILPAWRTRYAPGMRLNTEHVFALRLPRRCVVRLNRREHLHHQWLDWHRAAAKVSSWTNRDAILRIVGRSSPGGLRGVEKHP
jgi:dATP pyrophosphohydrolase